MRIDNPSISSWSIYLEDFERPKTDKTSVRVAAEYKITPLSSPQFKILAEIEFGDKMALTNTFVSTTKRIELLAVT
jgi:hypothetical protein